MLLIGTGVLRNDRDKIYELEILNHRMSKRIDNINDCMKKLTNIISVARQETFKLDGRTRQKFSRINKKLSQIDDF